MPPAAGLMNYLTIREAVPFSRIFFETGIFHTGFLYSSLISREGSAQLLLAGVGGAQFSILRINEITKTGASSAWALSAAETH